MKDQREIVVDVNHVTIRFNKANQKIDNLKEYFIKLVKHELMFQEFLAIKDVSFQVHKGGMGIDWNKWFRKSTILKAVSGIIKPYEGNISIKGSIAL